MTKILLNEEHNGVEIYFDGKPEKNILEDLKNNNFRWSNFKKCWYSKQSEKSIQYANKYAENKIITNIETKTNTEIKTASKPKTTKSLYERVQFTPGNTDISQYRYKFVGSNYTGLSVKETAAIIRTHLKTLFPEVKFSITSDYNKIDINIKSSPYSNDKPEESFEYRYHYNEWFEAHNPELTAIHEYCKSLLSSYNFDDSDMMSDYHHSHFYKHVDIYYQYIQTEQTEAIKNDIIDFRNRLQEDKKAEEERKEIEHQEYLVNLEKEKELNRLYEIESKRQIEVINSNIDVKDIEENNQYMVLNSQFANLNKNQTLDQYREEIKNNDFYLQNVKITKELHFQTAEALNYFSNHLLTDFDFLEGTGGSYTDDKRFTSMTDYNNMTKEEQETVIFNSIGVAVYYDNKLQFVIDAQGFSYARYVGLIADNTVIKKDNPIVQLISNEQIEALKQKADTITDLSTAIIDSYGMVKTWNNENWAEYKELIKDELKNKNIKLTKEIIRQLPEESENFKIAMYRLLTEVDGIQEQFKNADLKQGQKVTMFYITDIGMIAERRVIIDSIENKKYAQYDNAVKVTYKPEGKRKPYCNYFYSTLLVYDGWLTLPKTVLNDIEVTKDFVITKSKYGSCDRRQYDDIMEYFETNHNIKPIINTYKPSF